MGYSPPPSSDLAHYVSLTWAAQLGYGAYQTLRSWIADGTLPAVKIGSRVKVLRADLDALAVPTGPARFEDIESAVQRIAATAPPLTDARERRLASLLGGGA